ncbi:MAG: DUF2235 domain-containing protein [Marinibacterium sp.]|nr:DUF2235 domain-containing protein [Marinibacterium sp.]
MSKRIAVFCDGTWNSPTIAETTHVRELAQSVMAASQGNDAQIAHYFKGVGTKSKGFGGLGNLVSKYGGGAFGWGLNRRIKDAYRYIASNYEPGDKIYIFGFSRGAYTARSLAGLIRKAGIIDRVNRASVNRAFWLYKQLGDHNGPDAPHIQALRQGMSPRVATSQKDLDKRGNDGSVMVDIAYLGIWDTVGAMGIPSRLTGRAEELVNFRHRFHDMELSSLVQSARHAVAIDEQRGFFPPTLWSNLNRLSRNKSFDAGQAGSTDRPYQQMWFVGDHGTVGGSGAGQKPLSAITMGWIADGARLAGLDLSPDHPIPSTPPDQRAAISVYSNQGFDPDNPGALDSARGSHDKNPGPRHRFEIHPSAIDRLDGVPGYRPKTLRALFADRY